MARGLEPREVLRRVIGGAGQRACGHEQEAFLLGDALIRLKFLRRDKAVNGRMFAGRLEILADGEEVDRGRAQIVHHGEHLVARLAEADHHARLGERHGAELLGARQQPSEWR